MDLAFREDLAELETRFKRFSMSGTSDVRISGNLRTGFAVQIDKPEVGAVVAPSGTGACCNDTDCTITTQAECESGGGVYQGDDTVCDPNPCADCIPGNGLPTDPPTGADWSALVIHLQINNTAAPTPNTSDALDACSEEDPTGIPLTWHGQSPTDSIVIDATDEYFTRWDTDVDGDDWGNGDVGSWCYVPAYGTTGQFDGYFSHGECPGDPPCGDDDNLATYFELTEIRYGTVNGDTGWHVVTYGAFALSPGERICGVDVGTEFFYLNTFLGALPQGTVTRSLNGFTFEWVISYS